MADEELTRVLQVDLSGLDAQLKHEDTLQKSVEKAAEKTEEKLREEGTSAEAIERTVERVEHKVKHLGKHLLAEGVSLGAEGLLGDSGAGSAVSAFIGNVSAGASYGGEAGALAAVILTGMAELKQFVHELKEKNAETERKLDEERQQRVEQQIEQRREQERRERERQQQLAELEERGAEKQRELIYQSSQFYHQ